nr:uncharacterized protein LOC113829056 [Penaeus vannamei]
MSVGGRASVPSGLEVLPRSVQCLSLSFAPDCHLRGRAFLCGAVCYFLGDGARACVLGDESRVPAAKGHTRHLLARKMATRRKMSMSSLLGDVRKKVGRKMTIHDPSSVASLVGSLTHLRVLEEDARRGRASSEPPATVPDTHSDCSSDEKELEDDTAMEPEHEEDDDSDDDEFYIAYLMEMQEGDGSFMNGTYATEAGGAAIMVSVAAA